MYELLSQSVREARADKRAVIIAGDWNAEVESENVESQLKSSTGMFANAKGNNRGDWFKSGAADGHINSREDKDRLTTFA
eukprot:2531972-Karenia_brevis.AAC.1